MYGHVILNLHIFIELIHHPHLERCIVFVAVSGNLNRIKLSLVRVEICQILSVWNHGPCGVNNIMIIAALQELNFAAYYTLYAFHQLFPKKYLIFLKYFAQLLGVVENFRWHFQRKSWRGSPMTHRNCRKAQMDQSKLNSDEITKLPIILVTRFLIWPWWWWWSQSESPF